MRLIDADNLEFMMFKRMTNLAGIHGDLGGACAGVAKLIKAEKTVDPVVHAYWKDSDIPCEEYVCSNCGGAAWLYDYRGMAKKSKYCPNCGAKMDKKVPE